MASLVHGTTAEGFKAIMSKAGKCGLGSPWTVSDNDGMMYFYDAVQVGEEWGCDSDDEAIERAAMQAAEQAELQYACQGKAGDIIVLVCNVPDDIVEVDTSCENMEHCRMIPCDSFDASMIVSAFHTALDIWQVPYVLASVMSNSYFNTADIPANLLRLAESCGFDDDKYIDLDSLSLENAILRFA